LDVDRCQGVVDGIDVPVEAVIPVPQTANFGNDIGFRINGMRGDMPIGSVLVRIDVTAGPG
jgi:hypothetical protein